MRTALRISEVSYTAKYQDVARSETIGAIF